MIHGQIVPDPLDPAPDSALNFTLAVGSGDMFTIGAFSSPTGDFLLSYDYLGTCSTGNCGGFIGFSFAFPGTHFWLGGTSTASGAADVNEDTGAWVRVEIPFSTIAGAAFHVMIEDFVGPPGDAYSDTIRLESVVAGVPEPGSIGGLRRRR